MNISVSKSKENDIRKSNPFAQISQEELEESKKMLGTLNLAKDNNVIPIIPVPDTAPEFNFMHSQFGRPDRKWPYHNEEMKLICYISRWDIGKDGIKKKIILPICYCKFSDGTKKWHPKGISGLRPLYRLYELIQNKDKPILVNEGEPSADAARLLFPDYISTTPMQGANSPHKSDWSIVKNREVLIATDNDAAGKKFGESVYNLCHKAGAKTIRHLPVANIGQYIIRNGTIQNRSEQVPDHYDLEDVLKEGWDANTLKEIALNSIESFEVGKDNLPDLSILRRRYNTPPSFPIEVLPKAVYEWLSNTAINASAPIDYVAGCLLTTCASLIGNAYKACPNGDWQEPSAFWMALVGAPSSGKSPSADSLKKIIQEIEDELFEAFDIKKREYEEKKELSKLHYCMWQKAAQEALKKGEDSPSMPDEAIEPQEIVEPRFLISDITVEKLCSLINANPKGLFCFKDELSGWFKSFNKYNNGQGSDREFWLEAYGGRSYKIDRVKNQNPIKIPHLLVSVLGGIQPDKLQKILNSDDDGLTARFLYIWPESIEPIRAVDRVDNSIIKKALMRLAKLNRTEDNLDFVPKVINFSTKAYERFFDWQKIHYSCTKESFGHLSSFYGKCSGFIVRLSLVIEFLWWAVGNDTFEPNNISEKSLLAAAHLVDGYFKPMAENIFAEVTISDDEINARCLAQYIRTAKPKSINLREVYRSRKAGDIKTPEQARKAANYLMNMNWLEEPGNINRFGRKPSTFTVNPKLWDLLND